MDPATIALIITSAGSVLYTLTAAAAATPNEHRKPWVQALLTGINRIAWNVGNARNGQPPPKPEE